MAVVIVRPFDYATVDMASLYTYPVPNRSLTNDYSCGGRRDEFAVFSFRGIIAAATDNSATREFHESKRDAGHIRWKAAMHVDKSADGRPVTPNVMNH